MCDRYEVVHVSFALARVQGERLARLLQKSQL
jgi:hypothetical protein